MTESKKGKGAPKKAATKTSKKEQASSPFDVVLDVANKASSYVSPLAERVGAGATIAALRGQVEKIDVSGLKVLGESAEKIQTDLRKVLGSQSARAQELIGQARSQISALRP